MKFKVGLLFTTLLFLPGWYAIIALTINDGNNESETWAEMVADANRLLPFFNVSFTKKLLALLILSVLGAVVGLNIPRGFTRGQRILRTVIMVLGILSVAMLTFAFM